MSVRKSESAANAALRLMAETNGGPIDSGMVARLSGCSVKSACTAIARLALKGHMHLFRAVAGKLIYAFATEAHCTAVGAEVLEADARRRVRERLATAAARQNRAIPQGLGVDAPVTIKAPNRVAWASKEADTSRAKVTVCPSPQFSARYQYTVEAPDERWPSFAKSKPGVDPATGRAWA